ncbi:MAG: hypothetical protein AAGC56_01515 [Pseudomonadota bacterium]
MKNIVFGLIALALTVVGQAAAEGLTTDMAEKFAASLPAMTEIAKGMKERGVEDPFDDDEAPIVDGEFKPYSAAMAKLKTDHPKEHNKIGAAVKKHGFKSAMDWAVAGDATIAAYMARMIPPGAAEMMKAMTPQMLDMMPPETRVQYEQSKLMMAAIAKVSQADIAAVEPAVPALEAAFTAIGSDEGVFGQMPDAMPGGR